MARPRYRSDVEAALELATDLEDSRNLRRNLRSVEGNCWPQEAVRFVTLGRMAYSSKRLGMLALTSKRVMYTKPGITGFYQTVLVDTVSSVEWVDGRLCLKWPVASGMMVEDMPPVSGALLVKSLRARVAECRLDQRLEEEARERDRRGATPSPDGTAGDITARLAVLDRLLATGTITETEFRNRRAAILDGI